MHRKFDGFYGILQTFSEFMIYCMINESTSTRSRQPERPKGPRLVSKCMTTSSKIMKNTLETTLTIMIFELLYNFS